MFKLNPAPTFTAKIPLSVPGLPEPLELDVTYRHKNKTELQKWLEGSKGKADSAVLHEVITGWSGMQGEDGAEVPYSLDALTTLLENYPVAHQELYRGYLRELTESRRKNF